MAPPQPGLDTGDGRVLKVEGGLVDEEELLIAQRPSKVPLHLETVLNRDMHGRLEHDIAVLAEGFGLVQGNVGVAEEVAGGGPVSVGYADASRHAEGGAFVAADQEGLPEYVEQALGEHFGAGIE